MRKPFVVVALAATLTLIGTVPSNAVDGIAQTIGASEELAVPASMVEEVHALTMEGFTVVTPDGPALAQAEGGPEVADGPAVALTHVDDLADLDGDGLLDLISHVVFDDDSAEWIALSGLTGAQLYRFPAQPEFTYLTSLDTDVDGDGLSELVERRYEYGRSYHEQWENATCEDCPEGTTQLFERYSTISVRSGGSGEVLWTSEVLADVEHVTRIDEGDYYRSHATVDHTWFLGVVDGNVLMRTRHYDGEVVQEFTAGVGIPDMGALRAGDENGHRAFDNTITFSFLDAATGTTEREVVATIDRADTHAGAYLGDFDGDGSLDALIESEGPSADEWECVVVGGERSCTDPREDSRSPHVQVVDLTDGAVAWEAFPDFDGGFVSVTVLPDVDGDDAPDVLLDLGSVEDAWAVWSGATGDVVWERELDAYPRYSGQHDGQTLLTYTEAEYLYEDREDDPLDPFDGGQDQVGRIIHRVRLDAATGEELFRTTSYPQEGGSYVQEGFGPDADYDGDGVKDFWVHESTQTPVQREDENGNVFWTYEPVGEPVLYVESGHSGQVLTTDIPNADDPDGDIDVWVTADLDGDGGRDLRVIDWAQDTSEVRRGLGGTLWTLPVADYLYFAGDLDGVPGADLVQEPHCGFVMRNGASGDIVWSTTVC